MRLINLANAPSINMEASQHRFLSAELNQVKHSEPISSTNEDLLLRANPEKLLYSIRETANVLGVSYEFIRAKVQSGHIHVSSFGSRKLIHINELSRLISEGLPT